MADTSTQDNQKVRDSATKNFVDFVNGVKNTNNAPNKVYENMEKLFNVFTKGVLKGQGSNSEILMRTIYRALDEDFLSIIKNTKAAEKIADCIKEKQKAAASNPSSPTVTQTEKQVVTKTLDPVNCDILSVIQDFIVTIQDAVLQVKKQLQKEKTKQELASQKMLAEQEQSKATSAEYLANQGQEVIDGLPELSSDDEKWTQEKVKELDELSDVFSKVGANKNGESETSSSNPKKLVDELKGQDVSQKEIDHALSQIDQIEKVDFDKALPNELKNGTKLKIPSLKSIGNLVGDKSKLKVATVQQDSKLKVSPTQNSIQQLTGDSSSGQQVENDISKQKVMENLGIINGNIMTMLKEKKFQDNFKLNFGEIQKGVGKQMDAMNKDEQTIGTQLKLTETGIRLTQMKAKKNALLGLVLGSLANIGFIVLGGAILITLTRMAFSSWKKNFLPETEEGASFVDRIKNIGKGLWNTVSIGIPNLIAKFKPQLKRYKNLLFGRKGMFSNARETKNTLRKIFAALIIANTRQVGGWLVQMLFTALSYLPYVGPIFGFLAKFGPLIYAFVMTQIAEHWSNAKADAEANLEQLSKRMSSRQVGTKLEQKSADVGLPFSLSAIPGLETPRGSRGQGRKASAIMSHVKLKTYGREAYAKARTEQDIENNNEAVDKRYEETTSGAAYDTKLSKAMMVYGNNVATSEKGTKNLLAVSLMKTELSPFINGLDNYILSLKERAKTRFAAGRGKPLYDPNTGWNPGYRVVASDLYTALPLNPFEGMHSKEDIKFGDPDTEGDETYIGIQPFTWYQNGKPVVANPILFNLERAIKIRTLFKNTIENITRAYADWHFIGDGSPQATDAMKDATKEWLRLGQPYCGDYVKGYTVYDNDEFPKFLRKWQDNKVSDKDNNLAYARNQEQKSSSLTKYRAASTTGAVAGAVLGVGLAEGAAFGAGYAVGNTIGNALVERHNDKEFIANRRKVGEKYDKMVGVNGITWGDLKQWMFKGGIDALLEGTIINNPIDKANTLVKVLLDWGILPKGSEENDAGFLHHLIWHFMAHNKIAGYTWDKMASNPQSLAGFSQSLIEYFGLEVLPLFWQTFNVLSNIDPSYVPLKTLQKFQKSFLLVTNLLSKKSILDFLTKHLRFRNMKTKVIDEETAGKEQKKKILQYKKEVGIPTRNEVIALLKEKLGDSKEELQKKLDKVSQMLGMAEFEARFSGDYSNVDALKGLLGQIQNKLNSFDGTKVAKPMGQIQTQVIIPPKSDEEIEKERQEEQRRKVEQERKAKEEAERKAKEELEEKKKRAQEVAIAQAKIAAAEKIKKEEENYENVLAKMVNDPGKVTDEELNSVGKDIDNIKQEAENRIAQLPREERELKLALIRGDKVSPKTFKELKDTAVGLHGNLQSYIEEVNKIPCGSIVSVNNQAVPQTQPVPAADADSVDLGS